MIEYSGGKAVGVPMIQPNFRSKEKLNFKYELDEDNYKEYVDKFHEENSNNNEFDEWRINFDLLQQKINNKTKLLILNTPNNPTGKILSEDELDKIVNIVKEYPNLYIISDEVYEHFIFNRKYKSIPRIATKLYERTITIMSAGKLFSATGIRIGWGIGPSNLIKQVSAIHQYGTFCLYDPLQTTIADCLEEAKNEYKGISNYYEWLKIHYENRRNYCLNEFSKIEYFSNTKFFVPEAGFFIIADISNEKIENKNYSKLFDEINSNNESFIDDNIQKNKRFLDNMAYEKRVIAVPLSSFYTEENKHLGENYIRIAFCKEVKTINQAIENLKNKS